MTITVADAQSRLAELIASDPRVPALVRTAQRRGTPMLEIPGNDDITSVAGEASTKKFGWKLSQSTFRRLVTGAVNFEPAMS